MSAVNARTSFIILFTLSPPFGGMPQAASLNVLSASPIFYFTFNSRNMTIPGDGYGV